MNATDFFERRSGDHLLPPSSESFWSSVFAFFLLHLARSADESSLRIWQTREPGPPWYEPKRNAALFDSRGLTIDDVAVEPNTVTRIWPKISTTMTGIAPDLVLRFSTPSGSGYAFIETKITTGAKLNPNQLSSYPKLVQQLADDHGIDARFFVLKSFGCSKDLYDQTKSLELQLPERFAICLWEDIFRTMHRRKFSLPGLDIDSLQVYTNGADECQEW